MRFHQVVMARPWPARSSPVPRARKVSTAVGRWRCRAAPTSSSAEPARGRFGNGSGPAHKRGSALVQGRLRFRLPGTARHRLRRWARGEVFVRGRTTRRAPRRPVGTVAGLVRTPTSPSIGMGGGAGGPDRLRQEGLQAVCGPGRGPCASSRSSPPPSAFRRRAWCLTDVPFDDKSTVGVFGGDLGFAYDLNESVAIGIEAGLRYQTGLSDLEGLAGTGLEPITTRARAGPCR